MPSRLLTLMRKRGGFSPLSLNPTLLALPDNSFSRTGGQFTAASSQYLSGSAPSISTAYSVGGWLNTSNFIGVTALCSRGSTSTPIGFQLDVRNSSEISITVRDNSSSLINVAVGGYSTGTWYFVVAVRDGNTLYLYVNGSLVGSNTGTLGAITLTNVSVGGLLTGAVPGSYFSGTIDNVFICDYALTAGQVSALYNSGNGVAFQDFGDHLPTLPIHGWLDNSLTADAFGSNTLTNNNGVTQSAGKVNAVAVDNDPTFFVDDATANDNDPTQVTLASRPFYKSAGYWTFDGTDDFLQILNGITYGQEYTVIAVAKASDDTGTEQIVDADESTGGLRQFQLRYDTNQLTMVGFNTVNSNFNAVKAATPSSWNICVGRVSGASVNVFANGGTAGTATITGTPNSTAANGLGSVTLGRFTQSANLFLNGNIAHAVLFADTALTDAQLNAYGNYLVAEHPSLSLSWTDIT